MAGQYRIGFSAAEKSEFLKLPMVGASMAQMKSYLNLPDDQRANVKVLQFQWIV
jgi:hypothetical protein